MVHIDNRSDTLCFTSHMLAFWPQDPDVDLRIADIWDAGIEVTGEQFLPENHPVNRKIQEILARMSKRW